MSLLILHEVTQSFGPYDIFSELSAKIEPGDKVGLVGPNGVGKTTLLHLIAGLSKPTAGGVTLASETRVGYLHQEAIEAFAERANTVYEEMLTVFTQIQALASQLRSLEARMAEGEIDAVFEIYSETLEAYELAGGYEYEHRIDQVLTGLGLTGETPQLRLDQLSGGQQTRALLARLLLEQPDLLVLDEPTNHLDIQAVTWLENILRQWQGTMLIVSHDRYFLDRVVTNVWEMSRNAIETYQGNYTTYLHLRQALWERREKEFEAKKKRLSKEMAFIHKHIGSGRGRKIARGKLRRVSRELGAEGKAQTVARAKAKFKALRRSDGEWERMNITLQAEQRSGEVILQAQGLQVGYDQPLFAAVDLRLFRGECAALIGPNGAGKTTLLRTILGDIEPLAGTVTLGDNITVGYFAQAHDNLDPTQTVIEAFRRRGVMHEAEARQILARYLFQEEDVFKPVRGLSGGERARLALAILARQQANFLLLDEPTNHLDIPAQEVLQAVLTNFNGTILLISHDRYLINQLASQIWHLEAGQLAVFENNYEAFVGEKTFVREKS